MSHFKQAEMSFCQKIQKIPSAIDFVDPRAYALPKMDIRFMISKVWQFANPWEIVGSGDRKWMAYASAWKVLVVGALVS